MIGEVLRKARERKGLTVKDIEHGTSIRSLYIEAIENGDYDKLPGEVYTKGFIKNYGNFLELDGEALVRQFVGEISSSEEIIAESSVEDVVAEKKPAESAKSGNFKITELKDTNVSIRKKESKKSNSNTLIVAAVVLIAAIGGLMWSSAGTPRSEDIAMNEPTPIQTELEAPDKGTKQIAQTPSPVSATAATPASAAVPSQPNGVNLQANFTDQCWARVRVDGAVVYEGMISAGQSLNWQGNERINIRIGNAGAVELIQNGQALGVMGANGEVLERTFTKK